MSLDMLYWTPIEVRAFLRRWTVLKALIAATMLAVPAIPSVDVALDGLGLFRSTTMLFWYALTMAVWLWGCADYARSKGYSGWWGMLCAPAPLGPFGLIALFLFPDRWDPVHKDWMPEADPLIIDGERLPSARQARAVLRKSWTAKLSAAAAAWLATVIFAVLLANTSAGSADIIRTLALAVGFTASFIGLWGAAHLARYKGYQQLWAISGFVLVPFAFGLLGSGRFDIIGLGLLVMAFVLGPVTLLAMPDQWHDVGLSPMAFNPNDLSDLAPEPVFAHSHDVRIINPY